MRRSAGSKPYAGPTGSSRAAPLTTRERILVRSIYLFNRSGVQSVSIEVIAADMKISPGNLTYHFPRKRDLLRATLPLLEESLRDALAGARTDAIMSATESARRLINIFQTFWNFRFFFNELVYLLTSDPELRRQYYSFVDWALETLESDLKHLEHVGYFRAPMAPNNFRWLAENIWNLWLSWLKRTQITSPRAPTPRKAALEYCAIHYWSLVQLWLEPSVARQMLIALKRVAREQSGGEPDLSDLTNTSRSERAPPAS